MKIIISINIKRVVELGIYACEIKRNDGSENILLADTLEDMYKTLGLEIIY